MRLLAGSLLDILGELVDAQAWALAQAIRLHSAIRTHQVLAAFHDAFVLRLVGAEIYTATRFLLSCRRLDIVMTLFL